MEQIPDLSHVNQQLLERLEFWKAYAQRAENHAMVLAEQCEHLQNENHTLEQELAGLKDRLR